MKQTLIYIILSAIFITACRQGKDPSKPVEDKSPTVRVQTATVIRRDMLDTIWFYGTVKLRQEALLASQFDGRLTDFSLVLGDHVKKGEKLGTVIPPMREALLQTVDQLDASQKEIISGEIREIPLFSPINGVVLHVFQHSGDVLQKGETIVHIGDMNILDILGDLPVRYLPDISRLKALHVAFINFPHRPLLLNIQAVGGSVEPEKQTVTIRLQLNNNSREYRPGMQVKLYFPGKLHKNALVIPRAALLEEEGVYSVFVLHEDKKIEKRYITLGIVQDDYIEVLSGLEEGLQVVTGKAYSLIDGMEVIVE